MNKTLYRSQTDKIIAGVCGGLAEYFDVDSTIIRLLFILVVALGGSGIVIYLILWLIMPKGPKEPAAFNEEKVKEFVGEVKEKAQDIKEEMIKYRQNMEQRRHTHAGRRFFGWLLLVLGIGFLINNLVPHWMREQMIRYWPLILIVVAIALIAGARRENN